MKCVVRQVAQIKLRAGSRAESRSALARAAVFACFLAASMAANAQAAGPTVEATTVPTASPSGLAYDASGDLFVALQNDHKVVMVDTMGLVTTVAGTGEQGFAGDGGPATSALLDSPAGVAVDGAGNVYIADTHNHSVRKVSNGTIQTIAGTGVAGFSGDGAPASAAQLNRPTALSVDASGNLYIADSDNHRIRMVSGGVITTVAGDGEQTFSGDGGPATSAGLDTPSGVAVDPTTIGQFYISDTHDHAIRMVNAAGNITTVAGSGVPGFGGDGGAANAAVLARPRGVAVDASGRVYLADSDNNRIRAIVPATPAPSITTIAGTGEQGFAGEIGASTMAILNTPTAVASGPGGVIAFSDTPNQRTRAIQANAIATVLGLPPAQTEGILVSSAAANVYGTGSLTATFTNGGMTATGSASLLDAGAAIATTPFVNNVATFDLSSLDVGLHTFVVAFAGDTQNAPTASGQFLVTTLQASQTISFPQIATPVIYFPGESVTLGATASSGLPVTYSASGPATISGSTLTYTGGGTVVVTAIAQSRQYAAVSASQTVVVNALSLTGLSPMNIAIGSAAVRLTATGTGFAPDAMVLVNGTAVATAFVSGTTLTATLPATYFTSGQVLQVSVIDPTQNVTSNALALNVVQMTNTITPVGSATTPFASNALGANLFGAGTVAGGGVVEMAALKAMGVKAVRLNSCTWSTVETTPGSYSLPLGCATDIRNASSQGIAPILEAFPGPVATRVATMTLSSAASVGAMSLTFAVTSGSCGATSYPNAYVQPPSGVSTSASFYNGIYLTGVTAGSGTSCTLSLGSALKTTAAAGSIWTLYNSLYSPAASALKTDPSVVAFTKYAQALGSLANALPNAYNVPVYVELWNEPPWAHDCFDNRTDCFDNSSFTASLGSGTLNVTAVSSYRPLQIGDIISGTGLPAYPKQCTITGFSGTGNGAAGTYPVSSGCATLTLASRAMTTAWGGDGTHLAIGPNNPNYGFVIALQDSTSNPPNTIYINGASDKSGGAGLLLNTAILNTTGETYSDIATNPVNYTAWHPYGNAPEDKMPLSNGTNISPYNTPNFYLLISNNLQTVAKGGVAVHNTITETGLFVGGTGYGTVVQQDRWLLRQFAVALADGISPVAIYKPFDLEATGGVVTSTGWSMMTLNYGGSPCYNNVTCNGATSFTPLASYTSMSNLMSDINAIPYAPATSNMSTVSNYSGTYPLLTVHLIGSVMPGVANADMLLLWQYSNTGNTSCTTSGSVTTGCWTGLASPPPGTVTITPTPGYQIVSATDYVTGQPVALTASTGTSFTLPVADNLIGVLQKPIGSQ